MNNWKESSKRALILLQEVGLGLISIATLIAIAMELVSMIQTQSVTIADLLLLFIYLEVLAMVSIYFESGKMPLRVPLYIAIVGFARYLLLDMKSMDTWRMLAVAGATLLIALTLLVIRYGHARYPYEEGEHE